MESWKIDINCDVGEGVGNESDLFPHISSCNIACGGHAGDHNTMTEIIGLAKLHNIKIGAHPSYPDEPNFGRKVMDIPKSSLMESLQEQLSAFGTIAFNMQMPVYHIKPHGALYNQIGIDRELAQLFLEVVIASDLPNRIYAISGSEVAHAAKESGVEVCYEGFADRNYTRDGNLISRSHESALISEPEKVLEHILPMIQEGEVRTLSNEKITMEIDTLCVHGDTPAALEILQYLSKHLPKHHIQLT